MISTATISTIRKLDSVGGAFDQLGQSNGRPISSRPTPPGTPRWGSKWKAATAATYGHVMNIGGSGSSYAIRGNYLDLDPTYTDQPWPFAAAASPSTSPDNDIRMQNWVGTQVEKVARSLNPKIMTMGKAGKGWNSVPYQSTHNTGGAVMGTDPKTSAVNRYLQSWDVSNLFVFGASAFPQNAAVNPTGTVCALTYWAAEAIKDRYLKHPGPLVRSAPPSLSSCWQRRPQVGAAGAPDYAEASRPAAPVRSWPTVSAATQRRAASFLAGGLVLENAAPAGITAPNITPDNETGIGKWSREEFIRAVKSGAGPGGRRLYPAMPYPYYARSLGDGDAGAIFDYLQTVTAVRNWQATRLSFPYNIRSLTAGWNYLFFHKFRGLAAFGQIRRPDARRISGQCPAIAAPATALKNPFGADAGRPLTGASLQAVRARHNRADATRYRRLARQRAGHLSEKRPQQPLHGHGTDGRSDREFHRADERR